MFSYFGSKSKIVHHYPEPIYNTVIEPFAGSARYALRYWDRDVYIYDVDPVIIDVWKWLQQAEDTDILDLPKLEPGEEIPDLKPLARRNFLAFISNRGGDKPYNFCGKFCKWNRVNVILNLNRIRHWHIQRMCYTVIRNTEATWFIDPPYQFQGRYAWNWVNYRHLANWCAIRIGQRIVCEQQGATWLPFTPLVELQGQRHKRMEMIWMKP